MVALDEKAAFFLAGYHSQCNCPSHGVYPLADRLVPFDPLSSNSNFPLPRPSFPRLALRDEENRITTLVGNAELMARIPGEAYLLY